MTVSLVQWRAVIGIFNCCFVGLSKACNLSKNVTNVFEMVLLFYNYFETAYIFLLAFLYIFSFLNCHGDIELNPGPRKLKENNLSICHWNLNSITAHNFSKLTQLKAYISTYKHDFICLSETYLDSSIPDNLIGIEGYNLVRADHPDNIKGGGVCIYYKESLPVRVNPLHNLKEALLLEMIHKNNKVLVSVIYRSPSQNNCEFESFVTKFDYLLSEINKCKPSLAVITGDFNARSPAWWTKDVHNTEGSKLFSLTCANDFSQLINEPTHIQTNSSSCIDLVFTKSAKFIC